ncbi:unnamed protein product [Ixodes pacificus]
MRGARAPFFRNYFRVCEIFVEANLSRVAGWHERIPLVGKNFITRWDMVHVNLSCLNISIPRETFTATRIKGRQSAPTSMAREPHPSSGVVPYACYQVRKTQTSD